MTEPVLAYWFAASDELPHDDGRKVVLGETHSVKGKIAPCRNGLHASEHPFDALKYAPGSILYLVECSGDIRREDDKLACRIRKYIKRIDATTLLLEFARKQALSVIHLWDAPAIVRQYLETGDEAIREEAARPSAEVAARSAARSAAWAKETADRTARDQFKAMVDAAFAEADQCCPS